MIYLDNNATTQTDARVLAAMLPYFTEEYGNPSSAHKFGLKASMVVEEARESIARGLGAISSEIIFTAGATEANNAVLKGVYFAALERGISKPHFVVSSIEHKCVVNTAHFLQSIGVDVTFIQPNNEGIVATKDILGAITDNTVLVSMIWVNNEIGAINPVHEFAQLCRERGVLFHTDAAQAISKLKINVHELKVDFLTGSAQKFYGPKGTGLLYVANSVRSMLEPLLHGGGQEGGLRSGTLNVPGIVGMAEAVRLFCDAEWVECEYIRQLELANRLYAGLRAIDTRMRLNGPPIGCARRIANNINVSFPTINEKVFNRSIKGLMISSGSACSSADLKASYVLMGIGLTEREALKSYRIGLGKNTTSKDIDDALDIIRNAFESSTTG